MTTYGAVAEGAWGWVLEQVQWDDDVPWIPESAGGERQTEYADGMHSGLGGLALTLAEIRLTRAWTTDEQRLASAIADRIRATIPTQTTITYFDGSASAIGVLTALEEPGSAAAVERTLELATADGWHESFLEAEDKYRPGAVANDATLGTAGVLMGALWALRHGVNARPLADRAADLCLPSRRKRRTA